MTVFFVAESSHRSFDYDASLKERESKQPKIDLGGVAAENLQNPQQKSLNYSTLYSPRGSTPKRKQVTITILPVTNLDEIRVTPGSNFGNITKYQSPRVRKIKVSPKTERLKYIKKCIHGPPIKQNKSIENSFSFLKLTQQKTNENHTMEIIFPLDVL